MISGRASDPLGDAYLKSPPPGAGMYDSPPRPTLVTAAGVGRSSTVSPPTSPLNIVTDYDWGIGDDEPSQILQDLFPSIASTGAAPARTNMGPVPVRTSTPVTSPRPAIGDPPPPRLPPPPRSTTAGKRPRRPVPRRTPTRRRGTVAYKTTTTSTRTSRGGRSTAAGGAGDGDGGDSSSSSSGTPRSGRGGRGAARGGRGAARGTREGQAELRRRLEMLQEENRQRTAGRQIAGVTHTNTITTVYKDGRPPEVSRNSSFSSS